MFAFVVLGAGGYFCGGRAVVGGTSIPRCELLPLCQWFTGKILAVLMLLMFVEWQVIGELANNNGAMRPFVQTFVLASQSAKKYYVHNDIFRYQDDVFHANGPTTDPGFAGQHNHMDTAFSEAGSGMQCLVLDFYTYYLLALQITIGVFLLGVTFSESFLLCNVCVCVVCS